MKLNYLKKFLLILLLLNLNSNAADVVKNLKDMYLFSDQTVDNLIYQVDNQNDAFEFEEHVLDIIATELEIVKNNITNYLPMVQKIIEFLDILKQSIPHNSEKHISVDAIIAGLKRKLDQFSLLPEDLELIETLKFEFNELIKYSKTKSYISHLQQLLNRIKFGEFYSLNKTKFSDNLLKQAKEDIQTALKNITIISPTNNQNYAKSK